MGLKGGKAETQEAIVNNEGKLQISEIPAQSYYPRILFLFMAESTTDPPEIKKLLWPFRVRSA